MSPINNSFCKWVWLCSSLWEVRSIRKSWVQGWKVNPEDPWERLWVAAVRKNEQPNHKYTHWLVESQQELAFNIFYKIMPQQYAKIQRTCTWNLVFAYPLHLGGQEGAAPEWSVRRGSEVRAELCRGCNITARAILGPWQRQSLGKPAAFPASALHFLRGNSIDLGIYNQMKHLL